MSYKVVCANILDWCTSYDGEPFHAVLCDPPYDWAFMGKSWDSGMAMHPETWAAIAEHLYPGAFVMAFGGPRTYHRLAVAMEDAGLRMHPALGWLTGQGFCKATRIDTQVDQAAGKLDERKKIGNKQVSKDWSRDGLKGDMLVLGSARATTIDVTAPATDLARVWQGHRYGLQVLRPCLEFIAVAQKPYEGKPVDCITETGAGAIWVDGARIATSGRPHVEKTGEHWPGSNMDCCGSRAMGETRKGRWPANFALCHTAECKQVGTKRVESKSKATAGGRRKGGSSYGQYAGYEVPPEVGYADSDGFETVDDWLCVESCPVRRLGEQSGKNKSDGGTGPTTQSIGGRTAYTGGDHRGFFHYGDAGTVARYFFQADWSYEIAERLAEVDPVRYQSKAARKERERGLVGKLTCVDCGCLDSEVHILDSGSQEKIPARLAGTNGLPTLDEIRVAAKAAKETGGPPPRWQIRPCRRCNHPTLKPISLCRWLATLLLPPPEYAPRRILVPFAGSGSEMIAALLAGWEHIVGVELIPEYCDIAHARLAYWSKQPWQLELF